MVSVKATQALYNYVEGRLKSGEVKKDGSPSLNTIPLYAWRIQKVEKV